MEPPSKGDVLIIPGPSSINPEKIRVEWNQLFNSGAHDYYSIEASNRSRSEWTVFWNVAYNDFKFSGNAKVPLFITSEWFTDEKLAEFGSREYDCK